VDEEKIEELAEKVAKGEIKFYEVEEYTDGDSELATEVRRRAVEKLTGARLEHLGKYTIDANRAMDKNIENMIGAVQIPVGIAGPLRVRGEYADGEYYIPLATTEGALVASVNRGCSVITESGGAHARIVRDAMTRAPVFKLPNVRKALDFVEWVREHFDEIKEVAESTTRHGELLDIQEFITGRHVFLRFEFDTKDAMGMNMVTIAVEEAVKWIEENYPDAKCVSVSGNVCVDKKPSWLNNVLGRGRTVVAEVEVPADVVEEKLKTTPEAMAEVNYRKNLVGSATAGNLGFNAHHANVVAAIFLATGQDEAHVVDGSTGYTIMEVTEDGDLYASVTIPSLNVGTVGGGTGVETQRECLEILGVAGGGDPPGVNAKEFAEVVAAAVLAGELSLVAALAAGHLGRAHRLLGR